MPTFDAKSGSNTGSGTSSNYNHTTHTVVSNVNGLLIVTVAIANRVNDTAGVTEIAGNFVMGLNDTLCLEYSGTAWCQLCRNDN